MNLQTTILTKTNITYLVKFLILLAIATGAPMLGFHSQWLTGPIVNMALILSVFVIGVRGALLIGMLPSTIALGTGLLPAALAPMIPFIIIGNSILVLVLSVYPERSEGSPSTQLDFNYWGLLIIGAGLKFLFIFLTSNIVINLLLNQNLAIKVAQMMSWPQFCTALLGGILAFGLLKILKH